MGSYVQDQEKEDIQIVDIYWDRIYLHVKLAGRDIYHKEYAKRDLSWWPALFGGRYVYRVHERKRKQSGSSEAAEALDSL